MRRWVLVYNVTQETMCQAVNALTQFGQIARCCMMDNNIFVQFQQIVSAELAAMKRTIQISATTTIGIMPITASIIDKYQLIGQSAFFDEQELAGQYGDDHAPRLQRTLWDRLLGVLGF